MVTWMLEASDEWVLEEDARFPDATY